MLFDGSYNFVDFICYQLYIISFIYSLSMLERGVGYAVELLPGKYLSINYLIWFNGFFVSLSSSASAFGAFPPSYFGA
jgi:hypothetical protein